MRTAALAALLSLVAATAIAATDPAMGLWLSEDRAGKVELAPCHSNPALLCGAITWVDPSKPQRDLENPDPALRNRPLVGAIIVRDMKNEGPGRWAGGKVYEPKTGRTYNGRVRSISQDKLHLDGCVLVICASQTWTRTD